MANRTNFFRAPFWKRFVWFLLLLLSVVVIYSNLVGQGWSLSTLLLLLLLILNVLLAFKLFRSSTPEEEILLPRMIFPEEQPAVVREVMDVCIATAEGAMRIFRGPLREPPQIAYEKLKAALGEQSTPLLQEDERLGAAIFLMPKPVERALLEHRSRPAINWLLFFLTFLTTTWAGATYQGIDLLQQPGKFFVGLPYSLGLLAILGCHELGHYFAARRHNMNVTPPYFIPVPFALGTFGAFIKMKSPPEERTSLFDMAVAGPLAGLVIAIPALLIGLKSSVLINNAPAELETFLGGNPPANHILFGLLARLSFGGNIAPGTLIHLSPLAFAGTIGLIITALNLIPAGQLDGGHIARATFGNRGGAIIGRIAPWVFLLYAVKYRDYLAWAILIFFLAGDITPPMNDLTSISRGRRWLGYFSFLVLALILIPLPASVWEKLSLFLKGN